ncbi:hypothetical protein E1B28_007983 [Marasmius oreades]|uniref:Uncharacterized protein n=1 Tax=Marasmius oreades TaxID=181124 RepID=A0A9P7UUC1_9AGAR|nr:uncharacterized protein E1B28_007983 [Marasmius oreades]KAG7094383.1 hypothetical protein E1B28_007983 [Marasmius oreades]
MPPTNNSVETLHDLFDPHREILVLQRCLSPTSSIRGCYVRSRPTSFIGNDDQMQNHLLNFSTLGEAVNDIEGRQYKDGSPPPSPLPAPPPYLARGSRRFDSSRSRRSSRGYPGPGRYDADSVSVITTRTTISTFRAVRNPEATPPMLRQSEKGKKFSRSTPDLLYQTKLEVLTEQEKERDYKQSGGWKGGRRLKERFSLLFSGRKENAGILDRDGSQKSVVESGRKKSFSFRRAAKDVESSVGAAKVGEAKNPLELQRTRSGKSWVFKRRGTRTGHSRRTAVDHKGDYIELHQMDCDKRVRHSKSFAGFRASTNVDDIPPVPRVPGAMNEMVKEGEVVDEDIDEITREAAQVNRRVRRNFSYEENQGGEVQELE